MYLFECFPLKVSSFGFWYFILGFECLGLKMKGLILVGISEVVREAMS